MKVGDLVRFYNEDETRRPRGCLPAVKEHEWGCGLVQEVGKDGNVKIFWSMLNDIVLVDKRLLEVISEANLPG